MPRMLRFTAALRRLDTRDEIVPGTKYTRKQELGAQYIQRFVKRRLLIREKWDDTILAKIERKKDTRNRVREILLYVVFLLTFTFSSVLEVQDQDIFMFGNNIRGQLITQEFSETQAHTVKTFEDANTVEEMWQWAAGPLLNTLYTSGTWAGGDIESPFPGFVFGVNQLIGAVRIGQIRLAETPCVQVPAFSASSDGLLRCFGNERGDWSEDTEEKQPFGTLPGQQFRWEGWNDSHVSVQAARANGFYHRRLRTDKQLQAPAYTVNLPNRGYARAQHIVQQLVEGNYVDVQTRAVMVDFTVMNAQMFYFYVVRMTLEISSAGGVIPNYEAFTVRLYTLFDGQTWSKIAGEVLVAAFYLYYIVQEVRHTMRYGRKYWLKLDTLLHNLNLAVFVCVWCARLVSISLTPAMGEVVPDSDTFYDFGPAAAARKVSVYLNALNAFLCWFKLIRYMSYVPTFALVTGTLGKSAAEVGGFAVIFVLVFYGFAAAHMMSFGALVFDYRNMTQAILSLMTSLLGDFDLEELARAQWLLGPFFFVAFVALAVFVVLNVLIAIISDAYDEMRSELESAEDVALGAEMWEYITESVYKVPVIGPRLRLGVEKAKQAKAKMKAVSAAIQPGAGGRSFMRHVRRVSHQARHAVGGKSSRVPDTIEEEDSRLGTSVKRIPSHEIEGEEVDEKARP